MGGDVRHFRRKLFGGFDSHDVMQYIEELAAQRNKYMLSSDKQELELKNLNEKIKKLQTELNDADYRIKQTLDAASSSIALLKDTYSDVQLEMETTTNAISTELAKLNSTLTLLSSIIDKTGSRFEELQTMGGDHTDIVFSQAAQLMAEKFNTK
jgi:chromosome segregation ATPase